MSLRQPRVWVTIGGTRVDCKAGSCERKAGKGSDTFEAVFPYNGAARAGFTLASWASFDPDTEVQLWMSSTPGEGDARMMVSGYVDEPEIHYVAGEVSIKSRDKSARVNRNQRSKQYPNQSDDDVAQDIAQDAGLSYSSGGGGAGGDGGDDPGDDPGQVGYQAQSQTVQTALNDTDSETMSDLADRSGKSWFVDGDTLYLVDEDYSSGSFDVTYSPPTDGQVASGNCVDLKVSHNKEAGRPHEVTSSGFDRESKAMVSHTERLSGIGQPVKRELRKNNLTKAQHQRSARADLKNATRHELTVTVDMPGDLSADVRQSLNLRGSQAYDQSYQIDSLHFTCAWGEGLKMSIVAKGPRMGRS